MKKYKPRKEKNVVLESSKPVPQKDPVKQELPEQKNVVVDILNSVSEEIASIHGDLGAQLLRLSLVKEFVSKSTVLDSNQKKIEIQYIR